MRGCDGLKETFNGCAVQPFEDGQRAFQQEVRSADGGVTRARFLPFSGSNSGRPQVVSRMR